jgi:hypothetical protein
MKFDPISKSVFTDKDEFVKKLSCPYKMNWDDLARTNDTKRKCSNCGHFILDTEYLTDEELLSIVSKNPDTCLKIDLTQANIKIISNGILGQK